jgi:hypothetical protein
MASQESAGEAEARVTAQVTKLVVKGVRRLGKPRQLAIPSTVLRRSADDEVSPSISAQPAETPARAALLALLDRGEVRFKLYLWLRWHAQHDRATLGDAAGPAARPHGPLPQPSSPEALRLSHLDWAELLALPEPKTNGVKRVGEAIAWLEANEWITRDRRRPAALWPTTLEIWPLTAGPPDGGYAALPPGFWTGQWIGGLSARAIGALLILIDSSTPRLSVSTATDGPATFIAQSVLTGTYGVSEDFYRSGRNELKRAGLVTSRLNKRWAREKGGWSGVESTIHAAKLRDQPHPTFAKLLAGPS